MAFSQFTSERLGSVFAALGAFHGCRALYYGRVADTGTQVHTELLQRLSQHVVRGTAICDANGRDVVRSSPFRNLNKGFEDPSGVYV